VRGIAFQTGFMGDPADWYWRDFASFADIWTSYYTDREPESAFVAESNGRVVGYLFGCVESARAPSPAAALTRQTIRRPVNRCEERSFAPLRRALHKKEPLDAQPFDTKPSASTQWSRGRS
jgi:hypothetical protein